MMIKMFKCFIVIAMIFFTSAFAQQGPEPGVYTEEKLNVLVTKDQPQFVIRLKANPTTGFNWFLGEYDAKIITPIKHQYEAPTSELMGAPGYDVWTFAIKPTGFVVPRMTKIHFSYVRAWEEQGQAKQVTFRVITQ
jgi:inhibitor of cysteine peptidase